MSNCPGCDALQKRLDRAIELNECLEKIALKYRAVALDAARELELIKERLERHA